VRLRETLIDAGAPFHEANDSSEALRVTESSAPGLVVAHIAESEGDFAGVAVLRRQWPATPVVVLTDEPSMEVARWARKLRVAGYYTTDLLVADLASVLGMCQIDTSRLQSR
jgi:AmiR/NasT family two-component response regulator